MTHECSVSDYSRNECFFVKLVKSPAHIYYVRKAQYARPVFWMLKWTSCCAASRIVPLVAVIASIWRSCNVHITNIDHGSCVRCAWELPWVWRDLSESGVLRAQNDLSCTAVKLFSAATTEASLPFYGLTLHEVYFLWLIACYHCFVLCLVHVRTYSY